MTHPKLSIIIPTLNEASVLAGTIARLRAATMPIEIIVSDGGSTDGTAALATKLADRTALHTGPERQTIAGGRNAGAALANAEYLLFLDADVTVPNPDHFFATLLATLADPSVVACTTALRVLPEAETTTDRVVLSIINSTYYLCNNILQLGAASGEVQCIRASTFKSLSGFNPAITVAEDQEMFRRLRRAGRTQFVSALTAFHTGRRMHKTGWFPLFVEYSINNLAVMLLGRSLSAEWKPIR